MPRKFDFISPGIMLNEVDESVLPAETQDEGPLLIGRALTGPAMKPVRVKNLEDLYAIFGKPVTGKGALNSDVWRDGNMVAPTYAMFAAQAHLASNTTPVTFMRLVGRDDDDAPASSAGTAGWSLSGVNSASIDSNNTAYGLFVAPSGALAATDITGSLCAVFYTQGAALALSGTNDIGTGSEGAAELFVVPSGTDYKLAVSSSSGKDYYNFNFDNTNQNYIRNKFNTNPQKLDATGNFGAGADDVLFLGESFELAHADISGDKLVTIVPLENHAGNNNWADRKYAAQKGETGWFINRTLDGNQERLFKLIAHSDGEYLSANYWIQIKDLKLGNSINPNSSFTVEVMKNGTAIETYTGCDLNPSSDNYISKKIGDQYQEWDLTEKKYNVKGFYANRSNYFYVQVADAVENQTLADSLALPLGFEGPLVHTPVALSSGSVVGAEDLFKGEDDIPFTNAPNGEEVTGMGAARKMNFEFPAPKLTTTGSNGGNDYPATSVFGLRHVADNGTQWDHSYADVVRATAVEAKNSNFSSAYTFTLEDVSGSAVTGLYHWNSGSAAFTGNLTGSNGLFGKGIRKFAAPVVGGFDGVNIFRTDPFASYYVGASGLTSYERYTIDFALDIASDSEVVEYDLLSIPGQTNSGLTNRVISICETRGDALAIVDLEEIYENSWENNGAKREPTVTEAITNAQSRFLNSSYAATYYPSVRMLDTSAGNGDVIVVPPSVAAIGAIARSQALSDPWFAPAGFNRGGINELGGTQGPRVVGTMEHLSKANRDALYEENINPIARFPASGDIVIFGQKTLQQTPSALDRINVRRLLLYIKRRIGKISETILFDNNVQATWNRFKAQADIVLSDVQSRLGIVEYKLVLDETTTTADLVDRNILYAKVLIKPARAIEFIVVDFVVTRSGIEL